MESVKELQEELRYYLSFSDKEVFKGVFPPEETSTIPTEEANPQSTGTTPVSNPEEEATVGVTREPTTERRSPIFRGWEKVLHLSQPMVAAGQIPHLSRFPRLRFCNWEEKFIQIL